jgi:hypothetical protein
LNKVGRPVGHGEARLSAGSSVCSICGPPSLYSETVGVHRRAAGPRKGQFDTAVGGCKHIPSAIVDSGECTYIRLRRCQTPMKFTTIALSSFLMLSPTLALAQGSSSGDAAAAGGATGGPAGAGSSSAVKSDTDKPQRRAGQRQGPRVGRRFGHYRWRCDRWTGWGWIFQCNQERHNRLLKRSCAPLTIRRRTVSFEKPWCGHDRAGHPH